MSTDKIHDEAARSASRLGLIDRFLPPQLLAGPADLARRARLGVAFAWVSAGLFLFAGASQALASNRAAAMLDAFCAVVTLASPLVVRRTGRVVEVTHAVLALVFCAVVALAVLVRGAGLSGASLMLAVIPLFATLILGVRAGAWWLVPALAAGLGLGALGSAGLIVDHLAAPVRLYNDHLVLAVFTLALFAVAAVFEKRKDEALRQIAELEGRRRIAELGEMRAQAEAQLAQAEQFASLGHQPGSAAHRFSPAGAHGLRAGAPGGRE